jgi:ribose transport system substrate-binding protein
VLVAPRRRFAAALHLQLLPLLSLACVASSACGSRAPSEPSAPEPAPEPGAAQQPSEPGVPSAEPGDKPARRRIAVIPKGTTHEFWKSVHAGANKAGQELGVEILWKGPVREDDRDEQIKVVENFVASGVSAIVLAPLDDTALVPIATEASRERIPVVIIDSDIQWQGRVSFVATDNYRGGELAATRLGELLGGKGKVIVLRYQEGSASTAQREAGFIDTVQKTLPGIELVSSNQYGGATTETAYKTSENLLVKHRQIDGVFCPNESTTFGMLRALQDGKRAGQVKLVGFDSSEKLVEGLRSDQIHGLVLQNPLRMGELGVRAAVDKLDGKAVPPRIDTGVGIATRETMNAPEIKALLSPDLGPWLK